MVLALTKNMLNRFLQCSNALVLEVNILAQVSGYPFVKKSYKIITEKFLPRGWRIKEQ